MHRFRMLLSAAALLACTSCAASSLPGSLSTEKAFQDELDFAVDLARHRYFDLAGETIENLENYRLNPDQELSVNLTRFTVMSLKAQCGLDQEERVRSYREAFRQFKEIEARLTGSLDHIQIRLDGAVVCRAFGRTLIERMGGVDDPMRNEAAGVLDHGLHLLDEAEKILAPLVQKYEGIDWDEIPREFLLSRQTLFLKGTIHYYRALACVEEDPARTSRFDKCIETFDDYIWDSPGDDFYLLWAYLYQAMAYHALGDSKEALDLARAVVDPEMGMDLDQAAGLPPEYASLIIDLVETAYRLVAEVHRSAGDDEKSEAALREMRERLSSKGLLRGEEGNLFD